MDLPTLTDKDKDDLVHWAIPNDIDFIAASFVRKVWKGVMKKGIGIESLVRAWAWMTSRLSLL